MKENSNESIYVDVTVKFSVSVSLYFFLTFVTDKLTDWLVDK